MDTEQKRTYDKTAKKILSNKRILAHILQRVVDELRDKSIDQIVCYMDGDIEDIPPHSRDFSHELGSHPIKEPKSLAQKIT